MMHDVATPLYKEPTPPTHYQHLAPHSIGGRHPMRHSNSKIIPSRSNDALNPVTALGA